MTAMSNAGPKLDAEHALRSNGDDSGSMEVSMGKSTPSSTGAVVGVALATSSALSATSPSVASPSVASLFVALSVVDSWTGKRH